MGFDDNDTFWHNTWKWQTDGRTFCHSMDCTDSIALVKSITKPLSAVHAWLKLESGAYGLGQSFNYLLWWVGGCGAGAVYGAREHCDVDGQDADSRDAYLRRQSQRSTEWRHITDHVSLGRRASTQGLLPTDWLLPPLCYVLFKKLKKA